MVDGPDSSWGGPRPWSHAWPSASARFWGEGAGSAGPAAHFRTSAHAGTALAGALLVLLREVDERLGSPASLDVVDVGAGDGELLDALLALADPPLAGRLRPVGVDLRARPEGLDPRIAWLPGPAPDAVPRGVRGLLVASEWLDELPVEVVAADDDGVPRTVLVDLEGQETLGEPLGDDAREWLRRWWPDLPAGARAEVGIARDRAWQECVDRLAAGTALAIDYGHLRGDRATGRYAAGTLVGYRGGRLVLPRPDGSVNLTAHVAIDATAAAVSEVEGASVTIATQRESLLALGLTSSLPGTASASTDPAGYADALQAASYASELLDPAGLGAFRWLRVDR